MVIGYGFRDRHINDALLRAAEKGLRIFVVDPRGSDLVQGATSGAGNVGGLFKRALIGLSRRPIIETLRDEGAEFQKIERFFGK